MYMNIIKKIIDFFRPRKKSNITTLNYCELCNSPTLNIHIHNFSFMTNYYFCPNCFDFDTNHGINYKSNKLIISYDNVGQNNLINVKKIIMFYCFKKLIKDINKII